MSKEQRKSLARGLRDLRIVVQWLGLLVFLGLFVALMRRDGDPSIANIYSRLDPLLALASMVAARQVIAAFAPALLTVAVTLVVGRAWCGWICPLGTVLDIYGPRGRRGIPGQLRQAKYYILFAILFLAVFGSLAFMYLDPITVFIRGLAGLVFPALLRLAPGALPGKEIVGALLPGMAIVLGTILVLNLIERRFWCRYLCPLGGLIGLLSRYAWLKRVVVKDGLEPCVLDCPAGTNVCGYVTLASQGRYQQAAVLMRQQNPLTAVCGHVCPHPCEGNCNRQGCDQAVAISSLERFIGDHTRQHGLRGLKPVRISKKQQVAVVGAGPAGLTAAYHLRRLGYPVTVFEKLPAPGGMLLAGIPSYRLPREVLQGDVDLIEAQGVEIQTGVEVDAARLAQLRREFAAVFIGVGAHKSRQLGVPGEDLAGVLHGVDFLRRQNLNEGATIGSSVAVIGGGDVAMDAARSALRLGSQVTIFYRRSRKEMPATAEEIAEAEEEGVKFEYLATPVRIVGESGRVVGMECIRLELGAPDASGRPRPLPLAGSEFVVPVDTVIPAIGQYTDTGWLADSGIEVAEGGRIRADAAGMTSAPGVFAGGDAVGGPATVAEAVGAGARAARAIDRHLRGEPAAAEAQPARRVKFEEIPASLMPQKQPRVVAGTLAAEARKKSFDEVRLGLAQPQARAEAGRCLNWNCAECTLCAQACPMGTIDAGDGFKSHPSECIMCLECPAVCSPTATRFRGGWLPSLVATYDPSRRQFLASAATALVGFGLLKVGVGTREDRFLLRPPGAHGDEFLARCVRCGQCIKACPNSALRMTLLRGGWDSFWTPILVPRSGNCDYNCNTCGQVCPSGGIPPLSLEQKRKAVIGTAQVDRSLCISCMLCKDPCPTKAIAEVTAGDKSYPQISADLCIGCGTCEHTCPIQGDAAIRVYARGFVPPEPPAPAVTPTPTPQPGATPVAQATSAPTAATVAPAGTPAVVPSDKRAWVDRKGCIRCMICVKKCPQKAIAEVTADDTKWPQVDRSLCIGCGICEQNCPRDPKAIKLYDQSQYPG